MLEQFRPREVYRVAREVLSPYFRGHGYKRTQKMGPGPSWERQAGSGYLLVGVHAGNYFDVLGGKFEVGIELWPGPALDSDLLGLFTDEQMQAWKDIAMPIYGRALGLLPGGTDDPALQQERRHMYATIGVTSWDTTEPAWFGGFPWFRLEDLQPQFDFIKTVLPEVESRVLKMYVQSPDDW